jgi:O-antigen/teichoic acid export membrane protein
MEDAHFRAKVINAFIWLSSGTLFIQVISWTSTIIVIRLLSPSDYGLMAMIVPIIFFIQILSSWGLGAAIVQHKELNDTKIRQLFGFIILVFSSAYILIYLIAPFIAKFFNEVRLTSLLRVLGVNLPLMSLYVVPDSLFYREMNFRMKTKVEIASRLGAAIVSPVCAINSMGVWSLVLAEVSVHVIRLIYFNLAYRKWHWPIFHFTDCIGMIKYSITVTGGNVFNYIFNVGDKIIVGKFLGKNLLGIYSVAFTLALLPKEKIMPIITQLSFSAYSTIQDDVVRIKLSLLRSIEAISFVAFPLFWGMACVASEGIPLILGSHWVQVIVPFQFICIVIPLISISPIFPSALNAVGRQGIVFSNSIIESSIMVIVILIGVRFGLLGICITWIIFYPIAFLIISQRSLHALGSELKDLFRVFYFPVVSSIMVCLSVLSIKRMLIESVNSAFMLVISVVIGLIVYSVIVFIFKRDSIIKIRSLFLNK